MHFLQVLLAGASLAGFATAEPLNTTQSFRLVTKVKGKQDPSKAKFDKLYLAGYHSGAGTNDAVLLQGRASGIHGFFNKTDPPETRANGKPFYDLLFDIGDYTYAPIFRPENFYVQWAPISLDAGGPDNTTAYFFNKTGLHVSSAASSNDKESNAFGGWLACKWSRGVPQLFIRLQFNNQTTPSNCANVNLLPEYF